MERVLNVVFAGEEQHRPEVISDKETDHKKAADIETECAVLLENNGILPLNTDRKVAHIGNLPKSRGIRRRLQPYQSVQGCFGIGCCQRKRGVA